MKKIKYEIGFSYRDERKPESYEFMYDKRYEAILKSAYLGEALKNMTEEDYYNFLSSIEVEGDKRKKGYKDDLWRVKKMLMDEKEDTIQAEKRAYIHSLQKCFDMDIACCKLMSKDGNDVMLSCGSDGTGRYAIIHASEDDKIPSYYKYMVTLKGKFKIMKYDCSKSYEDDGEEIEGWIFVYRAGMSFIFKISN